LQRLEHLKQAAVSILHVKYTSAAVLPAVLAAVLTVVVAAVQANSLFSNIH
jgi:hypothetical protein